MSGHEDILQNEEVMQMLNRMRAACAVREYCEKDIREKIAKTMKTVEGERGDEAADAVVEKLKEEGFLSDRRYAAAFARDKAHLLGWGPQKIRYALVAKHIDKDIVDEALSAVDSRAAEGRLEILLRRKAESLSSSRAAKDGSMTEAGFRAKLLRFALGRGYSYDDAAAAVARLSSKRD